VAGKYAAAIAAAAANFAAECCVFISGDDTERERPTKAVDHSSPPAATATPEVTAVGLGLRFFDVLELIPIPACVEAITRLQNQGDKTFAKQKKRQNR
jgi:hypothetical protein